MELQGDGLHSALIELHYNFLAKHYLKAIGNVGISANVINFENFELEINFIDGFGAGYAYDSPINPIQLMASHSTQLDEWRFYLYFGMWF